jgi:hypothetical protein
LISVVEYFYIGGNINNNGKVSLLYQDGEFVDRYTKIITRIYINAKIDKQWENDGKLSLNYQEL